LTDIGVSSVRSLSSTASQGAGVVGGRAPSPGKVSGSSKMRERRSFAGERNISMLMMLFALDGVVGLRCSSITTSENRLPAFQRADFGAPPFRARAKRGLGRLVRVGSWGVVWGARIPTMERAALELAAASAVAALAIMLKMGLLP